MLFVKLLRKLMNLHHLMKPAKQTLTIVAELFVSNFLNSMYSRHRVPLALVYGDLYGENMIYRRDPSGYILYDWGRARIDAPFSNVMALDTKISDKKQGEEGTTDSYLGLWMEYGSLSELRKICHDIEAKDDLVSVLEVFEYASGKRLHRSLKDEDMTLLYDTLRKIQRLTTPSKHATKRRCLHFSHVAVLFPKQPCSWLCLQQSFRVRLNEAAGEFISTCGAITPLVRTYRGAKAVNGPLTGRTK